MPAPCLSIDSLTQLRWRALCAQCVLQLSPSTPCDGGITAFAAVTFAVFTVGFFAGAWALALQNAEHPLVRYLTSPYSAVRLSRQRWAVPHRVGRKLWFALLMSAWPFSDTSTSAALAVVIFVSLIVLLAAGERRCPRRRRRHKRLPVREGVWLQPYTDPRDNQLEVACTLLLLFGYFVSVLPGSSAAMGTCVTILQCLLIGYCVQRWLQQRLRGESARGSMDTAAASVELDDPEQDGGSGSGSGAYRSATGELWTPLMPLDDDDSNAAHQRDDAQAL